MSAGRTTRVMLTGGAGFIGSNLVHHLLHTRGPSTAHACCPDQEAIEHERPHAGSDLQILNVDALTYAADTTRLEGVARDARHRLERADICDQARIDRLVAEFEPDVIVNLAAETHVDRSIEDAGVFLRTNVLGTHALLEAARRHDVARFIQVSTDEVYGSIVEGSFSEADPCHPSNPYSASKAGADHLVLSYHETHGLPALVTRCTNNYGPRQHAEKLVPKAITHMLAGSKIPIYGNGSNVRDWIYVRDHCSALAFLLDKGAPGEVYNIAGQNEVSNLVLVRELLRLAGRPESLLQFVKDRPGHDFRYSLDDRKLRALGWKPRMPLPDGLRHTMDWYQARARVAVTSE